MNDTCLKIKTFFGRLGAYLSLTLTYRYWSRLYQLIWEWRYRDIPLASYRSIDALVETIKTCRWVTDGPKQLWDAFSCPGRIQYIINTEPAGKRLIGDCDEFALYLARVLEQSSTYGGFDNGRFSLDTWYGLAVDRARVLTVAWITKEGKYSGHNVCLIDWIDTHETDFFDGCTSYMDYGDPHEPQGSVLSVVNQIMEDYAPEANVLAWSVHDKDLKLQESHWAL